MFQSEEITGQPALIGRCDLRKGDLLDLTNHSCFTVVKREFDLEVAVGAQSSPDHQHEARTLSISEIQLSFDVRGAQAVLYWEGLLSPVEDGSSGKSCYGTIDEGGSLKIWNRPPMPRRRRRATS